MVYGGEYVAPHILKLGIRWNFTATLPLQAARCRAADVLDTVQEANPPFSFLNPTLNLGNSLLSVNLSVFIFPNINSGMVSELPF